MKKLLFLLSFFITFLYAKEFSVATYNVENLFDLNYDKSEYNEYIPNNKSNWNKRTYTKKLENISNVIIDLNADILALQEVESESALDDLNKLTKYPYKIFKKYKNSSVGLGFLSRYEIVDYELIDVKFSKVNRPILKTTFKIDNKTITIFNNHWPSKRNKESQRVLYAQALKKYLENKNRINEYIILGDLNSNYNENETFKYSNLNDTYGNTAINDVLKSNDKIQNDEKSHYNLWNELTYNQRFSYKYKSKNDTPDNILLSTKLFDEKDIDYVKKSFQVFKPNYLYKNNKIQRWSFRNNQHQGEGYSDHLPIIAKFSTSNSENSFNEKISSIKSLYENSNLNAKTTISNLILIYKTKEIAILKELNGRAIFVYKDIENLEFNKTYTINVNELKYFNGLLEITNLDILNYHPYKEKYEKLYLDGNENDILDINYQNEVVTNLKGNYENGFFNYFYKGSKKSIKLYSKDKELLPKNGAKISILSTHLGFYKNRPQLIIYKKSDYKYAD